MKDKVQLIKEEIERLFQELKNPLSKGILKYLDEFINSLPEEPVSDEEIEALNDVRHLNPGLDSLYWKLKKS